MKLVGIDRQIKTFEEWLTKQQKKAALLYGPPGVGKTSTVYYVAQKHGYYVEEINTSDTHSKDFLLNVLTHSKMRGLVKKLILFEEVDGAYNKDIIAKIIKESRVPVALTANDINKVSKGIRSQCVEIRYYHPRTKDLLYMAKAYGLRDYTIINKVKDFRQVIAAVYGSQGYEAEEGIYAKVQRYFQTGEIDDAGYPVLVTLLDNTRHFYGLEKLWFIKAIELADKTGRVEPLHGFKAPGKKVEMYYLKKRKGGE